MNEAYRHTTQVLTTAQLGTLGTPGLIDATGAKAVQWQVSMKQHTDSRASFALQTLTLRLLSLMFACAEMSCKYKLLIAFSNMHLVPEL